MSGSVLARPVLPAPTWSRVSIQSRIFSPRELVSGLSQDMTVLVGDLICCGTWLGVGTMKDAVNRMTIAIDGIGELHNEFRQ